VSDNGLVIEQNEFLESTYQVSVDLKGNFLCPAFRDGHAHPLFAGRESRGLDISDCLTEDQLVAKIHKYAEQNQSLTWLDAAVFDRSLDLVFNRHTLDRAVKDRPLVIHGEDHHTLWVNSKALEVAGLLAGTIPSLDSGSVDLDVDGIPTGILREWPAMSLVMALAPKLTQEEDVAALVSAEQKLFSSGIVECVDAWIDHGMAETYLAAWQAGKLQLDYTLGFRADPASFTSDLEYFILQREMLKQTKGQVKGSTIKFFADGVFGSATALVTDPYLSTGETGTLVWAESDLRSAIHLAHNHGFQIHIHAIGDAATRLCLEIISGLSGFNYPPVIAHAELTDQALLNKMSELGVIACVQPYWAQNNGLLTSCQHHLGTERLNSLYSFKDMFDTGVTTVFSSDWPISSYEPIKGLAVAVNRREYEEQEPHNPSQAISVEQAILAYSSNVKKMLGSSNNGTLDIGEPFDAVILDKNILATSPEQLAKTKVLATYKLGIELYRTNP
jgi:predicted amidohydrolase YtcJ